MISCSTSNSIRAAVLVPLFNAENRIAGLLESLLAQTRLPDEIILVDDGSSDSSGVVVAGFAKRYPIIKYDYRANGGAASARNAAWRMTTADICVFTDDDCLPERNWLEEMLKPFADPGIGGVGGIYKTLRPDIRLAKFIGLELEYKYGLIEERVDCHPTASLAVRRRLLEALGGFNEKFGNPCADDWDLTYKLSARSRLVLQKTAVTGHLHPERLWPYLKSQYRRALNRIRLYREHPEKKRGDAYTDPRIPRRILSSAAFLGGFIFYPLVAARVLLLAGQLFLFLGGLDFRFTLFLIKRDPATACYGVFVQSARNFAWLLGIATEWLRGLGNRGGKRERRAVGNGL
ncbi:glycosyltransferase [Deltaproteobacteria bacterium PRO3]|nr:glycosyltransferase [Deltaproteobacteria bacterium PRO3]